MNRSVYSIAQKMFSKIANTRVVDSRDLYKAWESENLKRFLQEFEIDYVVDVGANVGQYASMLRKSAKFKGCILSIEPIPSAARFLKQHSGKDSKWEVLEVAVSRSSGKSLLNIMRGDQFSSMLKPERSLVGDFQGQNVVEGTIEVETVTLQDVYNILKARGSTRPFLKLDTQGLDLDIVSACPEAAKKFIGIQSELSFSPIYENQPGWKETISFYEKLGFKAVCFIQNNRGHFPNLIESDCLMMNAQAVGK